MCNLATIQTNCGPKNPHIDAIIPSIQVSKRIRSKLQITYYRGTSNAHSTFQGICPPLVSCNGVQPLSVTSTFQNNFPFPLSEPPYYTFKQPLFFICPSFHYIEPALTRILLSTCSLYEIANIVFDFKHNPFLTGTCEEGIVFEVVEDVGDFI